eukprot:2399531-Pleurochrysis_carterae.AAC.2
MSLVGADLDGTASGDPTDFRFDRPYRASPTGLVLAGRLACIWWHAKPVYISGSLSLASGVQPVGCRML